MKTRKTSNNRMLLITEARKQLNPIVTESLAIPPDHSLVFTECMATCMPVHIPNNVPIHTHPHINFGTHKLKRKDAIRILDDEEQLYWMNATT